MLPNKEPFYSNLNIEGITNVDNRYAGVWKKFSNINLCDYYNLHVQSDTLLLADIFTLKTSVIIHMSLILLIFYQHLD